MLAVCLAPLLVTASLFHLDRFDPAAPITYVFFALVLTMTVAALRYLFEQPVIVPSEPADSLAPTARLQVARSRSSRNRIVGISAVRYRQWTFGFDLGVAR
jgi:hypothetical protein